MKCACTIILAEVSLSTHTRISAKNSIANRLSFGNRLKRSSAGYDEPENSEINQFYAILYEYGALAEKLGTGLQNQLDGSVTRRCLQFLSKRGWWNRYTRET